MHGNSNIKKKYLFLLSDASVLDSILLGWRYEIGGAGSTYGRQERCVKGFSGEI